MFFVNDDHAQARKGKEDPGARRQDQRNPSIPNQIPQLNPLVIGIPRMIHTDLDADIFRHPLHQLVGERNFRQEEEHLFASVQNLP